MSRYKCEKVVQGLNGDVISGASVSVYLSGTNTPAYVYLTKDASSGTNTTPQTSTGADGIFRFWVDSSNYDYSQRFRIEIVKESGTVTIDDVKIVEEDDWIDGIVSGDIQVGNADKVDGYNASTTPTANTIPVAGSEGKINLGWIPSGSGSGLIADKVDGYDAGNSSGQVAVSNGALCTDLNADKVDGYHASQTPTANTIPVAGTDGKLDSGWLSISVEVPGWVYLYAYQNIRGAL